MSDNDFPLAPPGHAWPADGAWTLHRCHSTSDDGIRIEPSVPLSAFLTIHVWSDDLEQWVRPTIINWKPGQFLATRR